MNALHYSLVQEIADFLEDASLFALARVNHRFFEVLSEELDCAQGLWRRKCRDRFPLLFQLSSVLVSPMAEPKPWKSKYRFSLLHPSHIILSEEFLPFFHSAEAPAFFAGTAIRQNDQGEPGTPWTFRADPYLLSTLDPEGALELSYSSLPLDLVEEDGLEAEEEELLDEEDDEEEEEGDAADDEEEDEQEEESGDSSFEPSDNEEFEEMGRRVRPRLARDRSRERVPDYVRTSVLPYERYALLKRMVPKGINGIPVSHTPFESDVTFVANFPFRPPLPDSPASLSYFEIEVISFGVAIAVGLCDPQKFPILVEEKFLGWYSHSYGYHADDGQKFSNQPLGDPYGPSWGAGDVVGCGIQWRDLSVFYTLNGKYLGTAFTGLDTRCTWFPAVSLTRIHFGPHDTGDAVETNFGDSQRQFLFDLSSVS